MVAAAVAPVATAVITVDDVLSDQLVDVVRTLRQTTKTYWWKSGTLLLCTMFRLRPAVAWRQGLRLQVRTSL